MADTKLTKPSVQALKARQKDYVEWCAELPGFGCRIRPTGHKSFIAQYRVGGRKRPVRKVTIGSFGKITVEQARAEAKRHLAKAALGIDVAAERAKRRGELTVAQLCDEYLEQGCDGKKPSTLATDKGRIERHIKKLLGARRISEVSRGDVAVFMRDVANGKTKADEKTRKHGRARVRGGKGAATRTVRLLGGIFSYAVKQGYLEMNPRHGVKVYPDGKGERFLNSDELARLGEALTEAESSGLPWAVNEGANAKHRPHTHREHREVVSPYAVAAIRLLLLTGCRAGEILNLMWKDVDFERGFLNLRDSKTGAKVVWLSAPALEVLNVLPRGGAYVIAGARADKPRSDLKRPWKRITSHAGLAGWRLHDLRHSFASIGAASGMGLGLVGKLLGHSSTQTTAKYSHFADNAAQAGADVIAAQIAAAMKANLTGKIHELRAAG